MKIFHLLSNAAAGGVARQLGRLAGVLQRAGVEQRAMFANNPSLVKRLSDVGVDSVEMDFPSRFAFLDRRRINAVIRRFQPDMVISWTPDVAEMVQKENFEENLYRNETDLFNRKSMQGWYYTIEDRYPNDIGALIKSMDSKGRCKEEGVNCMYNSFFLN